MNTPFLAQQQHIALLPWRKLRRDRGIWGRMVVLTLASALLWMAGLAYDVPRPVMATAFNLCALLALFVVWWVAVDSLLQQNSPARARLVPAHVGALRRSLVIHWLLATAVSTALLALSYGIRFAPFVALMTAVLLFMLVWLIRQPWWWALVTVVMLSMPWWDSLLRLAILALVDLARDPGRGTVVLACALLVLGLLLQGAIRSGSAAHRRTHEANERLRALSRARLSGGATSKHSGPWLAALGHAFATLWRWYFSHAVGRPGARNVMSRLHLVLGRQSHWTYQLSAFGLVVLLLFVPLIALDQFLNQPAGKVDWSGLRFGLCYGLTSFGLNGVTLLPCQLRALHREQGLLVLMPGVPQGQALGRAWGLYLTLYFLLGWTMVTAICVGTMTVLGTPSALAWTSGFCAGTLPFVVSAWRDWSLLGSDRLGGGDSGVSIGSALAMLSGTLLGSLAQWLMWPPAAVLGSSVILTAVLLGAAMQRQRSLPAPFPSGRLRGVSKR